MAEPVYKKITELDVLSTSIDGSETLPVVKSGKTYRRSWANLFGSGWITSLLGAFTAFKAPDADHADDADTVGGEDTTALHNAALLAGNIHLDRIPAELTGKNAASATLASTASACSGNAATATKLQTARTIGGVSFDGSAPIDLPGVNTIGNQNTSGNAATATTSAACSGNAATATTSASCSGNSATASSIRHILAGGTVFAGLVYFDLTISSGTLTRVIVSNTGSVPSGHIYIPIWS